MSYIAGKWRRVPAPLVAAALAVALTFAVSQLVLAAPGDPNFSWTPASPQVGQTVTFTATKLKPNSTVRWDFGDGASAAGASVTHAYATAGQKTVRMGVTRPGNKSTNVDHTITVTTPPPQPPAGGPTPPPGDTNPPPSGNTPPPIGGASPAPGTGTTTPLTGTRALELLSPFPVVRIVGRVTRVGTRIRFLAVRGPRGVNVTVGCRGRGCTFRSRSRIASSGGVRFRFKRILRPGARLAIRVTRPDRIGKYTSFRIRGGRPPTRRDLCLWPGRSRPSSCPST